MSVRPRAEVRLLGPIEVIGPTGSAVLPGSRQRALVGLLALRAGTVLAQSSLIDALWGDEPPRTAVKTLYSHVTRVRQALAACGLPNALVTRDPGYALRIEPADVDARQFEDLLRKAADHLAEGALEDGVAQLRAGLALWRGDPFADAVPAGWGAGEVTRLHEVRLTASEDLWDAELRLGRHAGAVGELDGLVAAQPYRERLVGLLMLARYRSGRHADALDAYQRLRARLADELGVDPGPELQRRYSMILRHDAELDLRAPDRTATASVPLPRPAQLPARVGHFTGRTAELDTLCRMLDDPGNETHIVAISGPAGMGKTALAVQWAHQVKDRFPDGQLFLDVRGHDPATAAGTADVLAHMLRSLGVPPERVPAELAEQTGLYRSLLHDKRILVVVDNAASADQVLPLVPANESSLLLITSRGLLTALSAHHAVRLIGIDVLERDDALRLLDRVLGAHRVEREPADAAELVELCVRMPLALRIAAAILAARADLRIAELAASLATEHRLDALTIEGDSRSVRAVFASAYHAVAAPAARLFRLLGLHPGVTFGPHLAAAAAAVPLADARRWIADLVTAHLVGDLGGERYRFHDLIRLYAYECAQLEESHAEREETTARILDWYLSVAAAANRTLDPSRNRVVPEVGYPPAELPDTTSHAGTLAFLDGERPNLVPLVRYAADRGHHTTAWQLTYLLTGFFEFRGHWGDRIEICRTAVAAAQRLGDPTVEGLMHSSLGVAYVAVRRFDEALGQLGQALVRMRAIGDTRGQGTAQHNIAVAYTGLRRFDQALDAFQQAVTLLHTANNPSPWIALALNNIGYVYAQMGRSDLSFEYLARALDLIRGVGDPRIEAAVLHSVGQTHLHDGDHRAAIDHFAQALAIRRDIGDRQNEVDTLNHLGAAHLARGAGGTALEQFQRALDISRDIADEHFEAVTLQHIGRARLGLGDVDGAREYLELALAVRTRVVDAYEEAHIHRDLDELERRCGNPSAARRHLLRAIELYRRANATAEAEKLSVDQAVGVPDPRAPQRRYRRQSVDTMVISPTPSSTVPSEGSKIAT